MKIKSFTLIEVIVATGIFAAVIVLATASYSYTLKSNQRAADINNLTQCTRSVEDYISNQLKNASKEPFIAMGDINGSFVDFSDVSKIIPAYSPADAVLIFKENSLLIIMRYQGTYKIGEVNPNNYAHGSNSVSIANINNLSSFMDNNWLSNNTNKPFRIGKIAAKNIFHVKVFDYLTLQGAEDRVNPVFINISAQAGEEQI